jgi:hypothetical protein
LWNKPTLLHLETLHCSKLSPASIKCAEEKFLTKGGSALLNKAEQNLNQLAIHEFLLKNPKLRVSLNRLQEKKTSSAVLSPLEPELETKEVKLKPKPKKRFFSEVVGLAKNRSKRAVKSKVFEDLYNFI